MPHRICDSLRYTIQPGLLLEYSWLLISGSFLLGFKFGFLKQFQKLRPIRQLQILLVHHKRTAARAIDARELPAQGLVGLNLTRVAENSDLLLYDSDLCLGGAAKNLRNSLVERFNTSFELLDLLLCHRTCMEGWLRLHSK